MMARPDDAVRPVAGAAVTILIGLASVAFLLIPARRGIEEPGALLATLLMAAFVLVTPILGALIAIRRPDNRIGWLFIAVVLFFVVSFLGDGIARHLQPTPPIAAVVVLTNSLGYFAFAVLFVIFQTFPTGHVPPGWRWLPAGVIAGSAAQAVIGLFGPLSLTPPVGDLENPFAQPSWQPALDALGVASGLILLAVTAGTLAALVLRFRRARGIERQQVKWFAWAAMLTVVLLAASLVATPWGALSDAFWSLALSSLVLLPVASAAAILRYRLYDIDRIISRTLSYTIVTALLAAVFAGLVLALQAGLDWVTGAGTLAIAASTLAVFALFQPLRRRVQQLVDRRFNRSRYDAEQTVGTFAEHLRGVTDLAEVSDGAKAVVVRALHPNGAAVWIRPRRERSA